MSFIQIHLLPKPLFDFRTYRQTNRSMVPMVAPRLLLSASLIYPRGRAGGDASYIIGRRTSAPNLVHDESQHDTNLWEHRTGAHPYQVLTKYWVTNKRFTHLFAAKGEDETVPDHDSPELPCRERGSGTEHSVGWWTWRPGRGQGTAPRIGHVRERRRPATSSSTRHGTAPQVLQGLAERMTPTHAGLDQIGLLRCCSLVSPMDSGRHLASYGRGSAGRITRGNHSHIK
jgi:hypothetical protein